jgi:hypothetical protein
MLRSFYRTILVMHPPRFRQRFAEEMLGIFDQAQGNFAAVRLVIDGIASLARQWVLRSQFWDQPIAEAPTLRSGGAPAFYTFDRFQPRKSALMHGAVLSLAIFCAVCFIMKHGVNHAIYMPFAAIVSEDGSGNSRPSARPAPFLKESAATDLRQNQVRTDIVNQQQNKALRKLHSLLLQSVPIPRPSRVSLGMEVRARPDSTKTTDSEAAMNSESSPADRGAVTVVVQKQALEFYVGTYVIDSPDRPTVSISIAAGELTLETGGEAKCSLTVISANRFAICNTSDLWIEFASRESGKAQHVVIHDAGRQITGHRR